jgi:hypothetical protein
MMLRVVALLAAPLLVSAVAAIGACDGATTAPVAPAGAAADDRRTPVTITTTPPGASVVVDGVVVGESPVTVPLNPGPHRLRATMSGYYPASETKIVVVRGEAATHTLALVASH